MSFRTVKNLFLCFFLKGKKSRHFVFFIICIKNFVSSIGLSSPSCSSFITYFNNTLDIFVLLKDQYPKINRNTKSSLNQYSVLPPISSNLPNNNNNNNNTRDAASARSALTDIPRSNDDISKYDTTSKDIPPLNLDNPPQNFNEFQRQPPMLNNEDTYLPEEPVLLTDYEEERLSDQIRNQLGNSASVERLKLFYQELTAYDQNVTGYVHYSNILLVASQLGVIIFLFNGK